MKIFKEILTPYIDAQTLLNLLGSYSNPRAVISKLIKKGEIIRLKNGFYLILDKISKNEYPYEQIANLLYGPSYVSLEWALSFYGMIPERVYTITSMTLGRNKTYATPIATFDYYNIPKSAYSLGVTLKENANYFGNFMIATPEKALTDLVFKKCQGLNKHYLEKDLIEDKRIDSQYFHKLNKKLLREIGQNYRSRSVQYLIDLVGII